MAKTPQPFARHRTEQKRKVRARRRATKRRARTAQRRDRG